MISNQNTTQREKLVMSEEKLVFNTIRCYLEDTSRLSGLYSATRLRNYKAKSGSVTDVSLKLRTKKGKEHSLARYTDNVLALHDEHVYFLNRCHKRSPVWCGVTVKLKRRKWKVEKAREKRAVIVSVKNTTE